LSDEFLEKPKKRKDSLTHHEFVLEFRAHAHWLLVKEADIELVKEADIELVKEADIELVKD
jgi:hypothetical protein